MISCSSQVAVAVNGTYSTGVPTMDGRARIVTYVTAWAASAADLLRQSGYVGTDTELAAAYVGLTGIEALAEQFGRDPGYPLEWVPGLPGTDAGDVIVQALECDAATGTIVVAALATAWRIRSFAADGGAATIG